MAALRDVANYGSNLIVRAFVSSPRDMAAIVACYVFLKQIVAMVDAVHVLLSEGAGYASHLPARSAFEASLYLHYVIENDSERRAKRYYVADIREQKGWARKLIAGTPEAEELEELRKSIDVESFLGDPESTSVANSMLQDAARVLGQPELLAIDAEFDAIRRGRKRDVAWYALDGIPNIRQLAKHLGRLAEYETFYSRGSQAMHSGTYKDHVRFIDNQLHAIPIRHIMDFNHLIQSVLIVAVSSMRRVVERYRSGEINDLNRRYLTEWREAMMHTPTVNYKFNATGVI